MPFQPSRVRFRPVSVGSAQEVRQQENVTIWGKGSTHQGSDLPTTVRMASTVIGEVRASSNEFTFDLSAGKGACNGDSGTDVLSDKTKSLLGIVSRANGDTKCEDGLGIMTDATKFHGFIRCSAEALGALDASLSYLKLDGSEKGCEDFTRTIEEEEAYRSQVQTAQVAPTSPSNIMPPAAGGSGQLAPNPAVGQGKTVCYGGPNGIPSRVPSQTCYCANGNVVSSIEQCG